MSPHSQEKQSASQGVRRHFFIHPRFQLSFLAYTVGVSALTIGFFYSADAYFFWKFNQLALGLGLPTNHALFQFINEQRSVKNLHYAIAGGLTLSFLFTWGLLLSHRVAGPLYRLRKHISLVAAGETDSDVRFRKGDFFKEVAIAYNLQMVRYRNAVGSKSLHEKHGNVENENKGEKKLRIAA